MQEIIFLKSKSEFELFYLQESRTEISIRQSPEYYYRGLLDLIGKDIVLLRIKAGNNDVYTSGYCIKANKITWIKIYKIKDSTYSLELHLPNHEIMELEDLYAKQFKE